jgi:hypothetical protein
MAKKRKYNESVESKIQKGENWTLHLIIEPDNAANILKDLERRGLKDKKRLYSFIINNQLRKSYAKSK